MMNNELKDAVIAEIADLMGKTDDIDLLELIYKLLVKSTQPA